MTRRSLLALVAAAVLLIPGVASPHAERPSQFPEPPGRVPRYRTEGPYLLVCKGRDTLERIARLGGRVEVRNRALYRECREDGFRHLQAAVDAVTAEGTRILVLPGLYKEMPSRRDSAGPCAELDEDGILEYEQHTMCPNLQNLVAILGDGPDEDRECDLGVCRLQIEGTGDGPEDVVIDNDFARLNAIRADRADGVYFRNFTVQEAEFNSLYVMETDGFVIDRVVARWNDEYGFLAFSSDHGLYTRCEAYGNGDGGLYPGSAADLHGLRPSIEIRYCRSHHNLLGYSGTAGNSTYVHHNVFDHNTVGVVMDSLFPDHPGLPQDSATFRNNRIYSNNQDYYRYIDDGTCSKPLDERGYKDGVVCPAFGVPIGTGILVAGGNSNTFERNLIWDNWRYGAIQFWIPAAIRNELDPTKQYDTSHFNRWVGNHMGISPRGRELPNGVDFWWDLEGEGNCWERNVPAPGSEITSHPPILPDCDAPSVFTPTPLAAQFATCATWSRENNHPPGCDWMDPPPRPA